jgi:hypothetical protein
MTTIEIRNLVSELQGGEAGVGSGIGSVMVSKILCASGD